MNLNTDKLIDKIVEMAIDYSPKILGVVITLILGFFLSNLIAKRVGKLMYKSGTDESLLPFITGLISIILKTMVLLSAASMFGLKTTSFVTLLGAIGFAIGMALQGNLSHLASGVLILIFKPFKVGDFIVSQGYSGSVKKIEIFNTILTTLDNREIIIPNGAISSGPIENLTVNTERKVPMTFGIGYSDDIDAAKKSIADVCNRCPEILKNKPIDILVSELADSSVNFAVRPWVKTEDYWTVHAFLNEEIKKEFDLQGIGIPFPQMDVHLQKMDA